MSMRRLLLCLFVILVRGGRIRSFGEERSGDDLKALWLAFVCFVSYSFCIELEQMKIGGEVERVFVSIGKDKELIK